MLKIDLLRTPKDDNQHPTGLGDFVTKYNSMIIRDEGAAIKMTILGNSRSNNVVCRS